MTRGRAISRFSRATSCFRARCIAFALLFYVSSPVSATSLDLSAQLTVDAYWRTSESQNSWHSLTSLQPEFRLYLADLAGFTTQISGVAHASLKTQTPTEPTINSALRIYRLHIEFLGMNSDLKLGLQKMNFGPAYILRSLRWFDQIDPNDPLKRTEGVSALRYRYFFANNANLWLWVISPDRAKKGVDILPTLSDVPEWGGRIQWPVLQGEVALSTHVRATDPSSLYGSAFGSSTSEKRLAVDGRWDLGIGFWFESMLLDQGLESATLANYYSTLTLGGDYTLAIGNGLHVLTEYQASALSTQWFDAKAATSTLALQASYPLSLLDAISVSQYFAEQGSFSSTSIGWSRVYDQVMLGMSYQYSDNQFRSGEHQLRAMLSYTP